MTTLLATNKTSSHRPASRAVPGRAFSLIEVLLAIFILGVGVISIAALFPAGIAQQRASVDDIFGPTIANNALSLLRTKLKPEDFGTFEQFGVNAPRFTINGDFPWIRPGFIFNDDPATPNLDERGAINVFSAGATDATEFNGGYAGSSPSLIGVPYNRSLYGSAPRVLVSQTERYYPSATQNGTGDRERPQYVWDCMFRKYQGKVLVAIFVYRVSQPGGGNAAYVVAPNPSNATLSPLPIALDLSLAGTISNSCANGPWNPGGLDKFIGLPGGASDDNAIVLGVPANTAYNPDDESQSWQEPRQWILDQNNNIHRVLGVSRDQLSDPQEVELVRAPPAMASIPVNYINAVNGDSVSDIWYMPIAVRDANGNLLNLTPVYATVKEL